MNQFVLAFPMKCAVEEPIVLNENVSITCDAKNFIIPGCGVSVEIVRTPSMDGVAEIFKEHQDVLPESLAEIKNHQSLLFLVGEVKTIEQVSQVNKAIVKLLEVGALGVYMQQSGAAWCAANFNEDLGDGEYPLDTWLNFVEDNEWIYTLGMACFALPDLCIAKSSENAQEALLLAADALFGDGVPAKSGSEVDVGETYTLRQLAKNPFSKNDPEYNKQGIFCLMKSSR